MLNVKRIIVESCNCYNDQDGIAHIRIKARPNVWHQDTCPYCGKRCPRYDQPTKNLKLWRGLDFGGIIVEIESQTHRVNRPMQGIVTVSVP